MAIEERAYTNWTFDNPIYEWQAKSTFELGSESSVKPNQYVAAARLNGETPKRDADLLFHFEPLPRETIVRKCLRCYRPTPSRSQSKMR